METQSKLTCAPRPLHVAVLTYLTGLDEYNTFPVYFSLYCTFIYITCYISIYDNSIHVLRQGNYVLVVWLICQQDYTKKPSVSYSQTTDFHKTWTEDGSALPFSADLDKTTFVMFLGE